MSENPQESGAPDASKPQPTTKKPRPAAPAPLHAGFEAPADPGIWIVDDDDAVLIPELAPERLASASLYGATRTDARAGGTRSLLFRRTMIPILLTCGVMFPTLAAMWFHTDPGHVVRRTGPWLPVTLIVLGIVFLLLAVMNMVQVRHLIAQRKASPTPR
jgi:hypothetical protein